MEFSQPQCRVRVVRGLPLWRGRIKSFSFWCTQAVTLPCGDRAIDQKPGSAIERDKFG
jgi:hypothetical protein